jgi:hypothetical protein
MKQYDNRGNLTYVRDDARFLSLISITKYQRCQSHLFSLANQHKYFGQTGMESCVGKRSTRKKTWIMHNTCIHYFRHTNRWNGYTKPSKSIARHRLPSGSHRTFKLQEFISIGEILGVCENIWSHLWLSWEKIGPWRVGAVAGNVGGILAAIICTWIHGKVDSRWKHI